MPNTIICVFKIAYTHHTREYEFPHNTTIREMIELVVPRVYSDFPHFNLDPIEYPHISIVETGQRDNANGHDPELAPALQPSDQTLKARYEGRHEKVGFYIRYSCPPLGKVEPNILCRR